MRVDPLVGPAGLDVGARIGPSVAVEAPAVPGPSAARELVGDLGVVPALEELLAVEPVLVLPGIRVDLEESEVAGVRDGVLTAAALAHDDRPRLSQVLTLVSRPREQAGEPVAASLDASVVIAAVHLGHAHQPAVGTCAPRRPPARAGDVGSAAARRRPPARPPYRRRRAAQSPSHGCTVARSRAASGELVPPHDAVAARARYCRVTRLRVSPNSVSAVSMTSTRVGRRHLRCTSSGRCRRWWPGTARRRDRRGRRRSGLRARSTSRRRVRAGRVCGGIDRGPSHHGLPELLPGRGKRTRGRRDRRQRLDERERGGGGSCDSGVAERERGAPREGTGAHPPDHSPPLRHGPSIGPGPPRPARGGIAALSAAMLHRGIPRRTVETGLRPAWE